MSNVESSCCLIHVQSFSNSSHQLGFLLTFIRLPFEIIWHWKMETYKRLFKYIYIVTNTCFRRLLNDVWDDENIEEFMWFLEKRNILYQFHFNYQDKCVDWWRSAFAYYTVLLGPEIWRVYFMKRKQRNINISKKSNINSLNELHLVTIVLTGNVHLMWWKRVNIIIWNGW